MAAYSQSFQHNKLWVMRSSWSASIVGDVNELKKPTKCVGTANRLLHCRKEKPIAVERASPGNYHRKSANVFFKHFLPPRENNKTYTCIKDTHKAIIQGGISSTPGKLLCLHMLLFTMVLSLVMKLKQGCISREKISSKRKRRKMLLLKYFFFLNSMKKSIPMLMKQKRKLR